MKRKIMLLVPLLTGLIWVHHAQAQCSVDRNQVLDALAAGLSNKELSEKFSGCVAVDESKSFSLFAETAGQNIVDTGSTFYEAITSCGYHPQRKELTCPIEIRQRFGFGGPPALQPAGSYEYVLFCVQSAAGLVPVNTNGVHVHDEAFGRGPNWQMTAVVPADAALFSRPLRGQTLRARAILSWAIPPAGCNFTPIWGNQADFRIRLDP